VNIKSTQMYNKIIFFNFFIALIGTTVIYFLDKKYAVFFLLGLILASTNLLVNLISVNSILGEAKKNTDLLPFLDYFLG